MVHVQPLLQRFMRIHPTRVDEWYTWQLDVTSNCPVNSHLHDSGLISPYARGQCGAPYSSNCPGWSDGPTGGAFSTAYYFGAAGNHRDLLQNPTTGQFDCYAVGSSHVGTQVDYVPCEDCDLDGDGYTESGGDCGPTDPSINPVANPDCQNTGVDKNCDGVEDIYQCGGSPIVIDVAGDGFKLTDAQSGVMFDLNGDGVRERLAWTAPGSDDAWLVLDRNHNGLVDGGE